MTVHDYDEARDEAREGPRDAAEAQTRRSASASRRALAVAVLFAMTLAGSWAAGKGYLPSPIPGGGATSPLEFSAPSEGPVHFSGRLDRGSVLASGDGLFKMELVLSADEPSARGFAPRRVPTDLVVVLDRSGSMQGKPLADAAAAVRELIARLGDGDRFALVTYSSQAQIAIPIEVADADARRRWASLVDGVRSGGGTNMAAGIDLAAQALMQARSAGRTPRVILLSDGMANEGDHSIEGLRARAGRAVAGEYVLSTVGVGLDFDERVMTTLADAGTGNFYYVEHTEDLAAVFAGEFASARETVASGLVVEVDLAPGIELVDAAGYPVERAGRLTRFRPGSLFAGQERRVWLSLRAPTATAAQLPLGDFRLRYRPVAEATAREKVLRFGEQPQIACVEAEEEYVASLDRDMVVRSLVVDDLSALKQQVAADVQAGRAKDAKGKIRAYQRRNRVLYGHARIVQEKAESYRQSLELEADVDAAFASPQAPAARNALGKKLSSEGLDERRVGAKH